MEHNRGKRCAAPLTRGGARQVVEQKGLDIVRRDWCPLSKDVGNFVLARILSGQPQEEVVDAIHLHLQEVSWHVSMYTGHKLAVPALPDIEPAGCWREWPGAVTYQAGMLLSVACRARPRPAAVVPLG